MRKALAGLLAVACVFALFGCGSEKNVVSEVTIYPSTEAPTIPVTEATTAVTEEVTVPHTQEYTQEPMVAVSLPVVYDQTKVDDVVVFTHTYQYMNLIQQDPDISDKIVVDFQNRLDGFHADVDTLSKQASNNYNGNPDNWTAYQYQTLYSPTRVDHNVLSLYGSRVQWTGGMHPDHQAISANYNMVTGDVLTLGSILYHHDQMETLANLVIEALTEIREEKSILEGYEGLVLYRIQSNVNFEERWYFSNEGLCFYFSPYEIAPYSSGTIEVTIPYEKLVGVIDDAFFPAESEYVSGNVQAVLFQDADHRSLSQIAEVILDREGEMMFIYTDGKISNVIIEVGQWFGDGEVFTPTCSVFSTHALTPGDAIMLQTKMSDKLEALRLRYICEDEEVIRYISQSEDGSILLTEE